MSKTLPSLVPCLLVSFLCAGLVACEGGAADEGLLDSSAELLTTGQVPLQCGERATIHSRAVGSDSTGMATGDLHASCAQAIVALSVEDCPPHPSSVDDNAKRRALGGCAENSELAVLCVDAEGEVTEDCERKVTEDNCELDDDLLREAGVSSYCEEFTLGNQTLYQATCWYTAKVHASGANVVSCVNCEGEEEDEVGDSPTDERGQR